MKHKGRIIAAIVVLATVGAVVAGAGAATPTAVRCSASTSRHQATAGVGAGTAARSACRASRARWAGVSSGVGTGRGTTVDEEGTTSAHPPRPAAAPSMARAPPRILRRGSTTRRYRLFGGLGMLARTTAPDNRSEES